MIKKFILISTYIFKLWLCWVLVAAQAFSLTVAGGGFSVVGVSRLLISMPSHCRADSRARDLQELQYSVLSTQLP